MATIKIILLHVTEVMGRLFLSVKIGHQQVASLIITLVYARCFSLTHLLYEMCLAIVIIQSVELLAKMEDVFIYAILSSVFFYSAVAMVTRT